MYSWFLQQNPQPPLYLNEHIIVTPDKVILFYFITIYIFSPYEVQLICHLSHLTFAQRNLDPILKFQCQFTPSIY